MRRVLDASKIGCTVGETAESPKLAREGSTPSHPARWAAARGLTHPNVTTPRASFARRSLHRRGGSDERDRPQPRSAARRVRLDPGIVAHLGERLTGSQEVRGSIPLSSTKFSWMSRYPPSASAMNAGPHQAAPEASLSSSITGPRQQAARDQQPSRSTILRRAARPRGRRSPARAGRGTR